MGSVTLGAPQAQTLALQAEHDIHLFIETGTYKAGTTRWAAQHFDRVITIEGYEPRYARFIASGVPENVTAVFGDSRFKLAEVLRSINERALYWLDAHWCGEGATDSGGDECPLREELDAILAHEAQTGVQHILLIDDARLFTAPPPYPHDPAQWMTYAEIVNLFPARRVFIQDDVIFILPGGAA